MGSLLEYRTTSGFKRFWVRTMKATIGLQRSYSSSQVSKCLCTGVCFMVHEFLLARDIPHNLGLFAEDWERGLLEENTHENCWPPFVYAPKPREPFILARPPRRAWIRWTGGCMRQALSCTRAPIGAGMLSSRASYGSCGRGRCGNSLN